MPSAADFKKAFHLSKGDLIGRKFSVRESQVGHEVRQENERYEFPTRVTLGLAEGGTAKEALQAFKAHVKESRIVYSAYGSPYDCSYGPAKASRGDAEEGTIAIACLGNALRRRDLPTLKEVKERERGGQGQAQDITAEEEELLEGMRVIKSRFGTSKCSKCGGTIDPGLRIARPKAEQGRGGWAHVRCVVGDIQRERGDCEVCENSETLGSQGPITPRKPQRKAAGRESGPAKPSSLAKKRKAQKATQHAVQAGRRTRGKR